jgi:acetyl-CoA carboxylase carboxyltransferase component
VVIDFYVWQRRALASQQEMMEKLRALFAQIGFPRPVRRIVVVASGPQSSLGMSGLEIYTFRQSAAGFQEEKVYRGLHPMMGKRLQIWRLSNFEIERLPSCEDVYLFKGVAKENPNDERLFAFAEVRDLTEVRRDKDRVIQLPHLELMLQESLAGIRRIRSHQPPNKRSNWNRVLLYIWPPLLLKPDELQDIIRRLAPATEGLGLEKVVVRARMPHHDTSELREMIADISNPAGGGLVIRFREPSEQPIRPISDYKKKVIRLQRRGLIYPYELVKMLTPNGDGTQADLPAGRFMEYDFDHENRLVPVQRSYGKNKANIVIGVIRNFTSKHPEGMVRVALFGDPSVGVGSLAEPECRRIIAGLDLAEQLGVPLEWFAVSAGAKISMDSGTENMDWIALVLRRLVEFTQAGGEVNIVVTGINVGAQPYWNAEATMLMHTRGILIMMPESAMVLTGKQALEYSGGVAAEDNQGIGGYERIMGPNGQAQYFAHDLGEACKILLRHYEHTYLVPGERFPRPAVTTDPRDRDVRVYAHGGEFATVGDVFSEEKNPGRKRPFDVRKVMMAVIDQDHSPLERWFGMQDAEIGVVWDAHLGGQPVSLLGFESRPLPRLGIVPADGPQQWTSGTLFPLSSKKIARAINAASGNRPLVVLANLSGFDGSPESMRKWQLEYGAEIGRAVVNFRGPIVFCVVSRYHGGAFVVFSNALHDNLEVAALEGTYASVIGGAPAAAVVFAREVEKRAQMGSRILCLEGEIALTKGAERAKLRSQWQEQYQEVYSEKLGEVADEFDGIHSVQRALRVGSVNRIIPPEQLRPYLIDAVERGMQRELEVIVHARQRPLQESSLKQVPQRRNGDGAQRRIGVGAQL